MAKVKGKVWKLTSTEENSTFRSKDFKEIESLGGFDSTRYKADFWFELDITDKCKQALTFVCANYPEIETFRCGGHHGSALRQRGVLQEQQGMDSAEGFMGAAVTAVKRRVTYYINDHEYFRGVLMREAAEGCDLDDILSGLPEPFTCLYTLEGPAGSRYPDRYELTDMQGHRMHIEALNGYQRGVVLVGANRNYAGQESDMYGIISIMEVRTWQDAGDADRKSLG